MTNGKKRFRKLHGIDFFYKELEILEMHYISYTESIANINIDKCIFKRFILIYHIST